MPDRYVPRLGGDIYNEAVTESMEAIDIILRDQIKLRALLPDSNDEAIRTIINDTQDRLLNIKNELITLRGIGIHYKEIRTGKEPANE